MVFGATEFYIVVCQINEIIIMVIEEDYLPAQIYLIDIRQRQIFCNIKL